LSNRRIFTKNGFLCKKTIDEIKFWLYNNSIHRKPKHITFK
jgi:hypothetical protein